MKHNKVKIEYGVAGYFKLVSHKSDKDGNPIPGTAKDRTGWIKNLITNRGMNCLGDQSTYGNFNRGCTVGSGNTAPAFTDTALVTRVANAIKLDTTQGRDLVASPNYVWTRSTYRFGTGVAAGNLTEVGLVAGTSDGTGTGGALNAGTPLSTRALIVDGGGTPTTVTILSDEILDVIYEIRMNIPSADVTGTVTIAGVDYDYIVRPFRIDTYPAVNTGGWGMPSTGSPNMDGLVNFRISGGHSENRVWCGAGAEIASATATTPSGTAASASTSGASCSTAAYGVDNHYRDATHNLGLGSAGTGFNLAGGIGVHTFSFSYLAFQINLDPHIPKDHTKLYSLTIRISWVRA